MSSVPSAEYHAAVEEGRRHHADSKTYSGSFLRPHKPFLTEMVERHRCRFALDVGAGKGRQWEWIDPEDGKTMEQAWGVEVTKHDPCWPPFASEPVDTFDLVLCTHTISLIPVQDLEWFTRRLYGFATKALFVAEKIGERKKAEVADPFNRAIGWTAEKWVDWFGRFAAEYPDIETVFSAREILPRGRITTRYIWRGGVYAGAIEAEPRG